MACAHLCLQILFFQKNCFAEYLVLLLNFTLSSIVFVNFLLVLREKSFCANLEVKKYSRIGSDKYSFECALAFITIHPWANSKWPIDQSECSLYFCYVIVHFVLKLLYLSQLCSFIYLLIIC